jgi:hypothetical protein
MKGNDRGIKNAQRSVVRAQALREGKWYPHLTWGEREERRGKNHE